MCLPVLYIEAERREIDEVVERGRERDRVREKWSDGALG